MAALVFPERFVTPVSHWRRSVRLRRPCAFKWQRWTFRKPGGMRANFGVCEPVPLGDKLTAATVKVAIRLRRERLISNYSFLLTDNNLVDSQRLGVNTSGSTTATERNTQKQTQQQNKTNRLKWISNNSNCGLSVAPGRRERREASLKKHIHSSGSGGGLHCGSRAVRCQ